MTDGLRDLLLRMRQHPAFRELLNSVEVPKPKPFKPAKGEAVRQESEWIFASGRARQDEIWRLFLTEGNPARGNNPSDQENP